MMNILIHIWFTAIMVMLSGASLVAADAPQEDTMLMFVGEDLEVLSIASRREQSAWQAPAVAQVMTREQIRKRGVSTLSEALSMVPGFYMAEKEWGVQPYLRGISDGVLFLYDTVPLGSDISKSYHPIDQGLSLHSIKRIEIVRGPGSVLWGPDAFAGIVNVVPMTGKDFEGVETGILYGAPGNQVEAFANQGYHNGIWDIFLSTTARSGEEDDGTANVVSFWGDGNRAVPPSDRYGEATPDRSRYLEASGRFNYSDWLSVSGRIYDFKKPYVISGPGDAYSWVEEQNALSGFLKLETRKKIDLDSAIRFTGSYSFLNPEDEIIDFSLTQKESTIYGELIYDRSFLAGRGLLTGGVSYRRKNVEDAPVWDGFLPDLLPPENIVFLPMITQVDYHSNLWSLFAQYSHKFGNLDLWAGARGDIHDQYEDHISYNAGLAWEATPEWMLKLIYGTAYRTPFSRQLRDDETPDLEKITTVNVKALWKPSKQWGGSVGYFFNHINNHIVEDYTGLSEPNSQDIYGVEIEAYYSPFDTLTLSANWTLIAQDGPDETYLYNDYVFIRPDGSIERHFAELTEPYDTGPKRLFNVMGMWEPTDQWSVFSRLSYFGSSFLTYPGAEYVENASAGWLLDGAVNVKDLFCEGVDVSVSVKNILNEKYWIPGTYSMIEGEPLRGEVTVRMRW